MFRRVREVSEALRAIAVEIAAYNNVLASGDEEREDYTRLVARLDDIERSQALWEAKMEAELLRAKAKYDAGRNAESRAKTQRAAYEAQVENGALDSPEEIPQGIEPDVYPGDDPTGEEDGMQQVPIRLEDGPKDAAMRRKFG